MRPFRAKAQLKGIEMTKTKKAKFEEMKVTHGGDIRIDGLLHKDGSAEFTIKVKKSQRQVYPDSCCLIDAISGEFMDLADDIFDGHDTHRES